MSNLQTAIYWAYASVLWLFNYYGINGEAFVILSVLLIADTAFGVMKSFVLFWEESSWFSSRKFKVWVISKFAIMLFVVLLALATSQWTWDDSIANIIVSSTLWLLIVAEFISIVQNIIMIRTKKEIEEWDAVTMVLTYVLDIMKKFIWEKVNHDEID